MMIRNMLIVALVSACTLPVVRNEVQQLSLPQQEHVQQSTVPTQATNSAALTWAFEADTNYILAGDGSEGVALTNSMIVGSDGNLYGATYYGGNDYGVFYKVVTTGAVSNTSSTYTVLHNFGDGSVANDAQYCWGKIVQDTSDYIYGTCRYGGSNDWGAVYRINPSNGAVTVLHSFGGTNDGIEPTGLVRDTSTGNLYGVTTYGDNTASCGTIFKLVPSGGSWTYSVLYRFDCVNGTSPTSLILASDGKLYGTCSACIWRYNLSTNTYTKLNSILNDAYGLTQIPTFFTSGNRLEFWGVTQYGGSNGDGSIFKVSETSPGSGSFTDTTKYSFNNATNRGGMPSTDLVFKTNLQCCSFDASGALYGTNYFGSGSFFRIDLSGNFWDISNDPGVMIGSNGSYSIALVEGSISGTPVLFGGSEWWSSINNQAWLWYIFGH